MKWAYAFLLLMFLSACQPQEVTNSFVPATMTITPISTASPLMTTAPSPTPTEPPPTATSTTSVPQVCSPLEEETFETLSLILTKPLIIPSFGHDDGHHGLDFAYYRRGERESIQGIEVYAILPGTVRLIMEDHIPYGYTILIETPFIDLPESLQAHLRALFQTIPENILYQGECPPINTPRITGNLSIYHLYAHLENKPDFLPGDSISCGEKLGTVGNTGRSSNPHLHLETRIGPSGATLGDMAFYQTNYTEQQRANYCLWRMSGYFQLFDPFLLFETGR